MARRRKRKTIIRGDVEKLTQIGRVYGNVIVQTANAIKQIEDAKKKMERPCTYSLSASE